LIEALGERQRSILKLLSERGALTVSSLRRALGVSEVTIRTDLTELESRGFLNRSRGGAHLALHPSIGARQDLRSEE